MARWTVAVVLVLALSACVSAPTQEMSDARRAVAVAEEAGARAHAAAALRQARRLLQAAGRELEQGRYREARRAATAAKLAAVDSREVALAISAALAAIEKARIEGEDVEYSERLLRSATTAAARGDSARARALATAAREHARSRR